MKVPVELRSESGQLIVIWPDGARQHLALSDLRAACPCGYCRGARLRGMEPAESRPGPLELTGIAPMGYGVQLVFSDGHDRGIYPWSWLENFAPDADVTVLPCTGT